MTIPAYSAEAVEAEHICDETTPRESGKKWRVVFYKGLRLYAVIPIAMSKGTAARCAQLANEHMEAAIENYIRGVATRTAP